MSSDPHEVSARYQNKYKSSKRRTANKTDYEEEKMSKLNNYDKERRRIPTFKKTCTVLHVINVMFNNCNQRYLRLTSLAHQVSYSDY